MAYGTSFYGGAPYGVAIGKAIVSIQGLAAITLSAPTAAVSLTAPRAAVELETPTATIALS